MRDAVFWVSLLAEQAAAVAVCQLTGKQHCWLRTPFESAEVHQLLRWIAQRKTDDRSQVSELGEAMRVCSQDVCWKRGPQ